MGTYVLLHGAWHTGTELQPVAELLEAAGHRSSAPTIKGNRPADPRTIGLAEAIQSIVDYVRVNDLEDIILVGHRCGGMIITGVADRCPDRIRRLVYWNAFVPNDGESLNDMLPPQYVELFETIAGERGDGSVVLPFSIWREAFMNDADIETAQRAFSVLNPHPINTLKHKISLNPTPSHIHLTKSTTTT